MFFSNFGAIENVWILNGLRNFYSYINGIIGNNVIWFNNETAGWFDDSCQLNGDQIVVNPVVELR